MTIQSKIRGPMMAHLRLNPGATGEDLAAAVNCSLEGVMKQLRILRSLPIGHSDRVRVLRWTRTADRGPWTMGFEFNHKSPDRQKPKRKTTSEVCKKWWDANKTKRNLTRSTIRGPRIAQGGIYGIWAGLYE